MANVQVFYEIKPLGVNCSIRANYRGKYGFLDTDNNGFIDPYDVYVKGYTLLNASVQKKLWKEKLTLQVTVDNITNHTDYLMPAQPGRIILAGASWRFEKTAVSRKL
jgi:outer membrane receptor for ferrienterochelin and colicins